MLAYLARGRQARTAYLSLTRGDGGQNLIGPELYELLGVIRTEELMSARRIDGAGQFFTRAYDFGFSKKRTEALSKWDREAVLSDVVRVIRTFRPLVVVSRFSGNPSDGHGHHQAAGFLTFEACKAAADPSRFSEQLSQGLRTWSVRKIYSTARERRRASPLRGPDNTVVTFNTGQFDPVLGRSYYEIAMEGRSQHRSQGEGSLQRRGPQYSRLRLMERSTGQTGADSDIFDGLDVSLKGIASYAGSGSERIRPMLEEAQTAAAEAATRYNPLTPSSISPVIARGLKAIRSARKALSTATIPSQEKDETEFLLAEKEKDFANALRLSAGVVVDCLSDQETIAPGEKLSLQVASFSTSASVVGIAVDAPPGWAVSPGRKTSTTIDGRLVTNSEFSVVTSPSTPSSQPYWLEKPRKGETFNVGSSATGIEPFSKSPLTARVEFQIEGEKVTVVEPALFRLLDRAVGEVRREIKIVPPVSISVTPGLQVFPLSSSGSPRKVVITVMSNSREKLRGTISLDADGNWPEKPTIKPLRGEFQLDRKGQRTNFEFTVTSSPRSVSGSGSLTATARVDAKQYGTGFSVIEYSHIEPRVVFRPATLEARLIDVRVAPNLKVGFIEGAGDDFAEALKRIAVDVTIISPQELASGDLNLYDTIVMGVRAYDVREDLVANNKRVLDYVNNGGFVIVQYNRNEYGSGEFAPFRFGMDARGRRDFEAREVPRIFYVSQSELSETLDDTGAADLEVGYIGEASERLSQRRPNVTLLAPGDITTQSLSRFDMVVIAPGAQAKEMEAKNDVLIDFSRRGSLLITYTADEYQSGNFPTWPRIDSRPYRVTDEGARITVMESSHPLFTYPNRISDQDFEGWVQERGTYFISEWDKNYKPLLESHDAGEPARLGGHLIASYGRGWYMYTGYAWFRQLPEGVPGAYRLIANLVSLPKAPRANSRAVRSTRK